jgi:hypothetical protein
MDVNTTVIIGTITRDAQARELPSGETLHSFDVSIRRGKERAEIVPVIKMTAEPRTDLLADTRVEIIGAVRKRFYQTGVGLQSRTEVLADYLEVIK